MMSTTTDKLNELLRDLISAQDDVTHYNESIKAGRHKEKVGLMLEAQERRDRYYARIVALFEEERQRGDDLLRVLIGLYGTVAGLKKWELNWPFIMAEAKAIIKKERDQ